MSSTEKPARCMFRSSTSPMNSSVPPRPLPSASRAEASPSMRGRGWLAGSTGLRYRLGVAARTVVAIGGGYGLSALVAATLSVWLPMTRVEAVVTGTLAAFVVYPCAVMGVFAARSLARAYAGLLVPAAVLGALLLVHLRTGVLP